MAPRVLYFLICFFMLPMLLQAQQSGIWLVTDARTKEPIPFATIRFGDSGQGTVAGLDGQFQVPEGILGYIEVSSLGYTTQHIVLPGAARHIYLQPSDKYLDEVAIKPPYEKMRRILNAAIAHKNQNNPDKYDWYRCHQYYKMIVDCTLPDSLMNDTSKDGRETADFLNTQYLLMSETYSIRTWQKPQKLQEQVVASRFSGLKKSVFTSMITDVLPFHAYNDYITMNGKDYHNPVSNGFDRFYKFNLVDELVQGQDTVWALSFRPNGHNANDLKGTVYINSDGYAISHIIAKAYDTVLKLDVRIEQQYDKQAVNDSESRWFPRRLNYVIDWSLAMGKKKQKTMVVYHMKGTSEIDSVTWQPDENFRFDKAHTVKLMPDADELTDTAWQKLRPVALDSKEAKTYHVIDSLGDRVHADKIMQYMAKLPEAKVPIGPVDMDLRRLFSFNQYEHTRLGLGLQTNEQVIKWASVGGWGGYGFGDKQWKYGAFAEVYADRTKEFVFRLSYSDDLADPGRVLLNRDLNKSYLTQYLLQRVDEVRSATLSVKKRIDYWNIQLSGSMQHITPMYNYALDYNNEKLETFTANEVTLNLRYAFAERTVPVFNYYSSLGSKYPIWYGKITTGVLGSDQDANVQIPYTQAVSAVVWHKHINRLGFEHFLIEGGKSWSDGTLPLSKLFAGNGFKYDSKGALQTSLYTFGGMMTIYPYQVYTDQYVNVIVRHDFDWKLYTVSDPKSSFSSAPNISLQYALLYGTMDHPERQTIAAFTVPDKGYNEAGMMLNNLLRLKYLNLYYLTLNMGYFYHIAPIEPKYANQNGRLTFGLGVEL
jgi:hypothetical protein